jgi:hypothetical protein
MSPSDRHDPVTVAHAQGEAEASIIRSFLESNGIRTHLKGEAVRNVYGLTMNGLGHVEIQVAPADEAHARELMEKVDNGELALPEIGLVEDDDEPV